MVYSFFKMATAVSLSGIKYQARICKFRTNITIRKKLSVLRWTKNSRKDGWWRKDAYRRNITLNNLLTLTLKQPALIKLQLYLVGLRSFGEENRYCLYQCVVPEKAAFEDWEHGSYCLIWWIKSPVHLIRRQKSRV